MKGLKMIRKILPIVFTALLFGSVNSQSLNPSYHFKPEIIKKKGVEKAIITLHNKDNSMEKETYCFDNNGRFISYVSGDCDGKQTKRQYKESKLEQIIITIDTQVTVINMDYDTTGQLTRKRIFQNDSLQTAIEYFYYHGSKLKQVVETGASGDTLTMATYSYQKGLLKQIEYTNMELNRIEYDYSNWCITSRWFADTTTLKMVRTERFNRKGMLLLKNVSVPGLKGFLRTRYYYSCGLLRKIRHTNGHMSKVRYESPKE